MIYFMNTKNIKNEILANQITLSEYSEINNSIILYNNLINKEADSRRILKLNKNEISGLFGIDFDI